LLVKLYIGIALLIGFGMAIVKHNGALLLGEAIFVVLMMGIQYSKFRQVGDVRFLDYCKSNILYLLAVLLMLIISLGAPLWPHAKLFT